MVIADHHRAPESFTLETLLGYLPEIKIDGVAYAQTSPMLIYFSKQGKMDKLTELEELKSGMMLETVTEVFLAKGSDL